jgi:hypothetical protein
LKLNQKEEKEQSLLLQSQYNQEINLQRNDN